MNIPTELREQLGEVANQPMWSRAVPYCDEADGTTAMNRIAENILSQCKDDMPMAFISCHVSKVQIVNSLLEYACKIKGLNMSDVMTDRCGMDKVSECLSQFTGMPLYIDDRELKTVDELQTVIRQHVEEKAVSTFYIDFYHMDEPEQLSRQITMLKTLLEEYCSNPFTFAEGKMSINYLITPIKFEK